MKKLVMMLLIAAFVLLCVPCTAFADEAYEMTDYSVHIKVLENNLLDVEERLSVNFTQERHGIYYNLQVSGEAYHDINGEAVAIAYNQKIYDFNVEGAPFELTRDGDYLTAKIGDLDKLVSGEQEYIITYKCQSGDDGFAEFDEFYRNIINCAEGDTIQNAGFEIEMPKDFDESKATVSLAAIGYTDSSGVVWEKDGNTLKGHSTRPITGGEIMTVRIELPNGYFNSADVSLPNYFILVYTILRLLFSV